MKNKTNTKKYFTVGTALATLLVIAAPHVSSAATYAYVNQSGDLAVVVANDPNTAIRTAANIDVHSGVILLKTASDYTNIEL